MRSSLRKNLAWATLLSVAFCFAVPDAQAISKKLRDQLRARLPPEQLDYDIVSTGSLLLDPQNFWLQHLLFQDEVTGKPTRKAIKFDGERYYAFPTTLLGTCYGSASVVERLKTLEVDKEYLFAGTVRSSRFWLFPHKPRYHYIVTDIAPAIDLEAEAEDLVLDLPTLTNPEEAMDGLQGKLADELLHSAHIRLVEFAKDEGLDLNQLFLEDSEHYPKTRQIVFSSVHDISQERKTTPTAVLAALVTKILETHFDTAKTMVDDSSEEVMEDELDLNELEAAIMGENVEEPGAGEAVPVPMETEVVPEPVAEEAVLMETMPMTDPADEPVAISGSPERDLPEPEVVEIIEPEPEMPALKAAPVFSPLPRTTIAVPEPEPEPKEEVTEEKPLEKSAPAPAPAFDEDDLDAPVGF